MGEDWLSGFAAAPLAWLAGAYIFGLATGWLFWGGRRGAAAAEGPSRNEAPPAGAKGLDALEREIRAARALLDEDGEEAEKIAGELASLDMAIKRANGRLKLILRAVQRAAGGGVN